MPRSPGLQSISGLSPGICRSELASSGGLTNLSPQPPEFVSRDRAMPVSVMVAAAGKRVEANASHSTRMLSMSRRMKWASRMVTPCYCDSLRASRFPDSATSGVWRTFGVDWLPILWTEPLGPKTRWSRALRSSADACGPRQEHSGLNHQSYGSHELFQAQQARPTDRTPEFLEDECWTIHRFPTVQICI